MAIRIASGRKTSMSKLQYRQMAISDDTEEVFIGTPSKYMKLLDEKDKKALETAIDNVEVDTTNLATKPELNTVTAALAEIGTDAVQKVATGDLTTTGRNRLFSAVSFITDDGFKEEYTILKDIFKNAGVPLAHALISGWLGKDPRCMTLAQAHELQSMGHEIMAHTVDHLELTKLTVPEMELQLKNSKKQLQDMGFKVESIVYPYGAWDKSVKRIARKYYRSGYIFHGGSENINKPPYNTFQINRMALGSYFDSTSDKYPDTTTFEGYYKKRVDELNANGGWLVITLHPGASSNEFTAEQQQYLVDTINYIKSLNIPVMNPRDVLNQTGNMIDAEGYSVDTNEERFFRVGANGKIESNEIGVTRSYPKDSFTCMTPYSDFPRNLVVHNIVTSTKPEGTPNGVGGLLITDTTNTLSFGDTAPNLFFQTFRERAVGNSSGKVYFRSTTGSSPYTWGQWVQGNLNVAKQDAYTFVTPASAFPDGVITQNVVSSTNLTGSPNNISGLLITDRTAGTINFVYQTFKERSPSNIPGAVYVRNTVSNGDWLPWKKLSYEFVVANDTYSFSTPASSFPDNVITQHMISSTNLTGSPNGVSGLLITDKTLKEVNFVYQTFKERSPDIGGQPGVTGNIYVRNTSGNGIWLPWRKIATELLPSTAPPTLGTHVKGDKVYNSNPTPGGYLGWVCVTAGTPGTWKGFGLIEV